MGRYRVEEQPSNEKKKGENGTLRSLLELQQAAESRGADSKPGIEHQLNVQEGKEAKN